MAFRLRRRHAIDGELGRVASEELSKAISTEPSAPEAIHDVRRVIKKLRAVLRLVKAGLPQYAAHTRTLRKTAHDLAGVRDAESLSKTMATFQSSQEPLFADRAAASFVKRVRELTSKAESAAPAALRAAIIALGAAGEAIAADVSSAADGRSMLKGLAAGYRRARRAMNRARSADTDEAFHCWRRRVKDHMYQMELCSPLARAAKKRGKRLHALEELLGDAHDMTGLRGELARSRRGERRSNWRRKALAAAEHTQKSLRKQALALGATLFEDRPRAFRRRARRWRIARADQ